MQRREFLITTALGSIGAARGGLALGEARDAAAALAAADAPAAVTPATTRRATRKILIAGGNFHTAFIRYMASLTGKKRPRVCYLPTASADAADAIIRFYEDCATLDVEPHAQPSFIESLTQKQGWDEVLLSMDAIVVSGGNTLNQQAIWKAQGIDVVLKDAWDRGIVLGGASAGSLCWFEEGTTDSRPKALSIVKCLGFLKGSHSPHYDAEAGRRPLYQKLIGSGEMKPGYACDNDAGIYFEDNDIKRVVSTRPEAKVYYVSVVAGKVVEKVMEPEHIE
jgi:peptidase E